jgi:hypothetical protein
MENKPYAKEPRNNNWYPNKYCQSVDHDFRKKTRKKKHIIWSKHKGKRLVTRKSLQIKRRKTFIHVLEFAVFKHLFFY